ncbi:MAG: tryptophan--tRNA ligase [Planctomycetota bacterium]
MARVLTGLQPTGQLHLGNYAGAIRQLIDLQDDHELYVFVASFHALTAIRDPDELRANVRQVVVDYLAFGLDPSKCHIYLQHDVPEVTELAWVLGCLCPKSQMDKATTYKDKTAKGLPANIGLYTYPILQAADILAVDPDFVPVGQDQRQHVEITRDLAQKFNHHYGEVFKVPEGRYRAEAAVVPGVDGEKMSKSYGNIIDPFLPEKQLRKAVMKIVSGSETLEEPKDPEGDTTFAIFRAIAGADDPRTAELAERYRAGGMGYGHAKQALFELLLNEFGAARERREELLADTGRVDAVLANGAAAAREAVGKVTARVRRAVGL